MNKKSQQLSKAQWLEKALTQLVKFGPQQLKIANLCQNFEVTKGSFYHHFKSRDDFVHALMQYWYEQTTVNFIAQANTQSSPLEKLQKLDQVIASNNIEAEIHIRAWSLTETFIVTHLEKIDSQRQAFLASCYQQLGLNPEQATDLAAISYAQFLGLLHIKPQPDVTQCLKLSALIARQFLPVIQQGD
ncbi:TetR/AcrR family transcriptional regulator [Pseudoalteromonas sp. MMG005]|uniref:TetR/AcrR family transcriptional regulator n=1 Tax=Pseudoalteromonas sp. MMG005 TaxID=2822682 RepID=UPI001B3A58BB|nr:TetR/AcrR family transcriptional regulator [Pseudoalteromonas sp. MMG005]MBQ4847466.1 TetR/AcrR family transcriptional regulator [Pseudoalteromonas sp. MMG005]